MEEGKVAVLGSKDFITLFSALGIDAFDAGEDHSKIAETARKILQGQYAVIVVDEDTDRAAGEIFARTQKQTLPTVVVIGHKKV